jgi:hypothetical protein
MDRLLEMSVKELTRLEVMQRLSKKQMGQKEEERCLAFYVLSIREMPQESLEPNNF